MYICNYGVVRVFSITVIISIICIQTSTHDGSSNTLLNIFFVKLPNNSLYLIQEHEHLKTI